MAKRKKIKKFRLVMTVVFIILFILLIFSVKDIIGSLKTGESKIEILDTIKDYNYSLNEYDSAYFKKVFKKLKTELKKKKVDEKEYAKLISELFVIDFYSLDDALNKNDVGGIQFVYTDYQEDFVKYAKDTIYKYVDNNIYGDRKQKLPKVKSVEVTDMKQDKVSFENDVNDDKAYYVDITINYDKDLEYQKNVELVIIHNDKKLEIAKLS